MCVCVCVFIGISDTAKYSVLNNPIVSHTFCIALGGISDVFKTFRLQRYKDFLNYNAIGEKKCEIEKYAKLKRNPRNLLRFRGKCDKTFLMDGRPFVIKAAELPLGKFHIATTVEQSDMAIITIGRKPGEGFDRNVENDFDLSETEKDLIKTVCEEYHQKGKQVIVILNTGGIVETASWKELPDAILMAWMPGQEGGNAVADVLTGKVNPSGRLPITFPVSYWDVPGAKDFPYDFQRVDDGMFGLSTILGPKRDKPTAKNLAYTEYNEGINVGYRYYTTADKAVSYPFGYGLSYTRFEYGKPVVKTKGNQYVVKVTVKNIGETAGKEVLQLYVSAPKGNMEKPTRELKAFGKTRELQPGESQTLTLTFNKYDLASFDESASAWKTDAGTYTIAIGAHVNDIKATAPMNISKSATYPVHNVLAPQK